MPSASARTLTRRHRHRRRAALTALRLRRLQHRMNRRLILFSGWTWVAAGSLVGFEMLDLIFGTFIVVPELLPLVLLGLALAWFFRGRIRRSWARTRARWRLLRQARQSPAPRSSRRR